MRKKIIPDEISLITGNDKRIYNSKRRSVSSLIKEALTKYAKDEELAALKIEGFMFKLYKDEALKPFLSRLVSPFSRTPFADLKRVTVKENRLNKVLQPLNSLEQAIIDSVCTINQLPVARIRDRKKTREMVDARYQIFQILYTICDYTLVDIGLKFNLNHATIISGLKNHKSFIYFDKKYTRTYVNSLIDLYSKPIDQSVKNEIAKEFRDTKIKEFIPENFNYGEKVNSNS
jgi:uncharacterized protein (UPF0305 family)